MKLIITRPLADSKRMQNYFELRGVECLINPLLEISYEKRSINFSNYDRVLLTSRHAVRSLVNKSLTFSKKKVHACGRSTYAEVREFAPENEYIFHESVNDLVDAFRSSTPIDDSKMLYLRGRDVTVDLKSIFQGTNIQIEDSVEYIARKKILFNKEALEEFNSGRQISVIIFSLRTAEIFLEALKKYNLGNKTSIIMAYCISKNIASMLQVKGIQSKILTEPTEDAILDLL
ncbi:MAG: uroporphyrinogen-III synthase [Pseudomonadota bacterium]|nr:uroporphyrinogen-III synthase [Pseudomonadota bacterium]